VLAVIGFMWIIMVDNDNRGEIQELTTLSGNIILLLRNILFIMHKVLFCEIKYYSATPRTLNFRANIKVAICK
jgi:hypothetical protein